MKNLATTTGDTSMKDQMKDPATKPTDELARKEAYTPAANIGDGNQEGAKPMIDFSNITHCYVRNDPWRRPIVKVSLKTVLFGPADERIDGTWVPCTRPEFTDPLRVRKSDFYDEGFFEATDSDGDLVLYRTDNPY